MSNEQEQAERAEEFAGLVDRIFDHARSDQDLDPQSLSSWEQVLIGDIANLLEPLVDVVEESGFAEVLYALAQIAPDDVTRESLRRLGRHLLTRG